MAKVTAPLLGFNSRGQIGKTAVYARWRGVQYARQHVIPANPRSTSQTNNRTCWTLLSNLWKTMPSALQDVWSARAKGQPFTNRNAWMSSNQKALAGKTALTDMVFSAGSGGGLPPTAVTPTPSSTSISFAVTHNTAPSGWTLTGSNVIAIAQGDPTSETNGQLLIEVGTSPWTTIVLTGLVASTTYVYGVYDIWTTDTGATVYSSSVQGTSTTT